MAAKRWEYRYESDCGQFSESEPSGACSAADAEKASLHIVYASDIVEDDALAIVTMTAHRLASGEHAVSIDQWCDADALDELADMFRNAAARLRMLNKHG